MNRLRFMTHIAGVNKATNAISGIAKRFRVDRYNFVGLRGANAWHEDNEQE